MTSLVFDTTALSHFARAGRMDELQLAVAGDEPVLLAEVAAELALGIPGYPALGSAAAGGWLKQVELEELPELAAFAGYKGELGGGPERNNGEAAVLAWVSVNGGIAIIDEVAARAMGHRDHLQVHGSLWLLIRSFKTRVHDRATVEAIVDDLIGTGDATTGRQRRGPFRLGLRSWNPPVARPGVEQPGPSVAQQANYMLVTMPTSPGRRLARPRRREPPGHTFVTSRSHSGSAGEPNGEPTQAEARLRQAISRDDYRS